MATTSAEVTHTGERLRNKTGLGFSRHFTGETRDAEHELTWELRTASISDANGSVIFEQQNVLAPATWSQTATNIVASKYFHGRLGSPEREHSVGQLVARVVAKGVLETEVEPIKNPVTGAAHRIQVVMPEGFEHRGAEVASANIRSISHSSCLRFCVSASIDCRSISWSTSGLQ